MYTQTTNNNILLNIYNLWQIWREYDSDNSGYIEADELKNFLRDLLREAKKINDVSEDKLIEYTDTMVRNNMRVIYFTLLFLYNNCFLTVASVRLEQGWSFAIIRNG